MPVDDIFFDDISVARGSATSDLSANDRLCVRIENEFRQRAEWAKEQGEEYFVFSVGHLNAVQKAYLESRILPRYRVARWDVAHKSHPTDGEFYELRRSRDD